MEPTGSRVSANVMDAAALEPTYRYLLEELSYSEFRRKLVPCHGLRIWTRLTGSVLRRRSHQAGANIFRVAAVVPRSVRSMQSRKVSGSMPESEVWIADALRVRADGRARSVAEMSGLYRGR